MPFVLIVVGVILMVTAIQGTTAQFGTMLAGDIFGSSGYLQWIVAIIVIGAVGYVKPLKPASDAFLVLVLLVLFLANGGVFAKIGPALAAIKPSSVTAPTSSGSNPFGSFTGAGTASPAGSSLNSSANQLFGGVPMTVSPGADPGTQLQPIPGL